MTDLVVSKKKNLKTKLLKYFLIGCHLNKSRILYLAVPGRQYPGQFMVIVQMYERIFIKSDMKVSCFTKLM